MNILVVLKPEDQIVLKPEDQNEIGNINENDDNDFKDLNKKITTTVNYNSPRGENSANFEGKIFKYNKRNNIEYFFLMLQKAETNINIAIKNIAEKVTETISNIDYIAFHPKSANIRENEEFIEELNGACKSGKPAYTFFSITNDTLNGGGIDGLITKVESRIFNDDLITAFILELKLGKNWTAKKIKKTEIYKKIDNNNLTNRQNLKDFFEKLKKDKCNTEIEDLNKNKIDFIKKLLKKSS